MVRRADRAEWVVLPRPPGVRENSNGRLGHAYYTKISSGVRLQQE
jgi:hypothetical protein